MRAALRGVGCVVLCAAAAISCSRESLPRPFLNGVYVWQSRWNAQVNDALEKVSPFVEDVFPYVGEIEVDNGALALKPTEPDWKALAATRRPTTFVLRAKTGLSKTLASDGPKAAAFIASIENGVSNKAALEKVTVAGLQLDYDCPTSKLDDYANLVAALRSALPNTTISITALPTWLASPAFKRLAHEAGEYVLQVHWLEKPASVDAPHTVCDVSKIPKYIERASALRIPYRVALPTYGYRAYFDASGACVAVRAESDTDATYPNLQTRDIEADPVALAEVVRNLRTTPPRACQGIVWFRMPVDSDRHNWPWPVLQEVMAGRAPQISFAAELRTPREDLLEVWVRSTGAYRPGGTLKVRVPCDPRRIKAYDCVSGFSGKPDADGTFFALAGPAPRDDEPVMAAWYLVDIAPNEPQPAIDGEHMEVSW